jgi:hypothetical protein
LAGIWETFAFIFRALGTRDQQNKTYTIVSQILVLLSPICAFLILNVLELSSLSSPVINAFVYMILGRMIYFFIPSKSIFGVKAVNLAKIFVWLDIFSFAIQFGGGILINPKQDPKILRAGIKVYQAGIGIQEFFMVCFTVAAVQFHREMIVLARKGMSKPRWLPLLISIYVVLAMITVSLLSFSLNFTF